METIKLFLQKRKLEVAVIVAVVLIEIFALSLSWGQLLKARQWMIPFGLGGFFAVAAILFEKSILRKKVEGFLNRPVGWRLTSLLCILGVSVGILFYGMRQFGSIDHAILIDSAWRLYQGQVPYQSFCCKLPPGFLIGGVLAFNLFGLRWFSLLLVNALFAIATFCWSAWLLRKFTKDGLVSLFLASLLQVASTVLLSHWWYNTAAVIAGILFPLSAIYFLSEKRSIAASLSYFGSLLLLVLMKPNIAGIEVVGITSIVFFASSARKRFQVIFLSGLAGISFIAILSLFNINLNYLLASYSSISQRAFTFSQFLEKNWHDAPIIERGLFVVSWIVLGLLLLEMCIRIMPYINAIIGIAFIVLLAGIIFIINGTENELVSVQLLVFGVWIVARECLTLGKCINSYRVLIFLCCFLLGASIGETLVRYRVLQAGFCLFFQEETSRERLSGDFFQRFCGSPIFTELHRELANTIPLFTETRRSVWFGPRLVWAYADFGLPSPINQPLIWEKGVLYASQEEDALIQDWEQKKFDVLIFFRDDTVYLPKKLLAFIKENYFLFQRKNFITVYYRK